MNADIFAGHTVEAARRLLTTRLRADTIDSAELDARILAGAVLGLDLTGMIAAAERRVTAAEAARLEDALRRRLAGEPVARIVGVREFWGLPLQLSAATLVPRPDTETVVELALEMLRPSRRFGSAAAHRRHRHRFRGDFAGAAVRVAGRLWRRHRHQRGGVADRTRQCRRSGLGRSRRFRRLRLCARRCRVSSI